MPGFDGNCFACCCRKCGSCGSSGGRSERRRSRTSSGRASWSRRLQRCAFWCAFCACLLSHLQWPCQKVCQLLCKRCPAHSVNMNCNCTGHAQAVHTCWLASRPVLVTGLLLFRVYASPEMPYVYKTLGHVPHDVPLRHD